MQPRPKRGRPSETDRHHVSLVALRLFERRGFDHVTMDDVAEAASVSRRTLFRLFPSKADLAWDGLNEALEAVKRRAVPLVRTPSPLAAIVDGIFTPTLSGLDDPAVAKLARRRLKLIAKSPALLHHQSLDAIQTVIAKIVARSAPSGSPPATLIARSIVAVGFAAVLWWAEHGGKMTAEETVRAALFAMSGASDAPKRTRRGA